MACPYLGQGLGLVGDPTLTGWQSDMLVVCNANMGARFLSLRGLSACDPATADAAECALAAGRGAASVYICSSSVGVKRARGGRAQKHAFFFARSFFSAVSIVCVSHRLQLHAHGQFQVVMPWIRLPLKRVGSSCCQGSTSTRGAHRGCVPHTVVELPYPPLGGESVCRRGDTRVLRAAQARHCHSSGTSTSSTS